VPPRFFLAERAAGDPELAPGESEHAVRVLRLRAGDQVMGVDGRGTLQPLEVRAVRGQRLELALAGPARLEPAPGDIGSPLPWIEVAVAFPRKARAEEMLGRLVQLGASGIVPLLARQANAAEVPRETPERWLKLTREALKQCERAWLPVLHAARSPADLARARKGSPIALLDLHAGMPFDAWLRSLRPSPQGHGTRARPITLAIGPEGGFAPEESEALRAAGAQAVRLSPYVLRIETAAEAAIATAAAVLMH
jgi:16S rRNA (uracil1498-N3)-methyltransferase